jgi:hypothetical protein
MTIGRRQAKGNKKSSGNIAKFGNALRKKVTNCQVIEGKLVLGSFPKKFEIRFNRPRRTTLITDKSMETIHEI